MLGSSVIRRAALTIAVAAAFSGPAFGQAAHEHQHAASGAQLTLNQGQKWQTDEPLRKGMEGIRAALAADLHQIHAGKQSAKRYDALAAKVNGEVAYVVQNCRLEKDADEQLHVVLAEIIGGADAMQGKETGVARRAGAERIADALEQYGRYFDHPNWRAL